MFSICQLQIVTSNNFYLILFETAKKITDQRKALSRAPLTKDRGSERPCLHTINHVIIYSGKWGEKSQSTASNN